MTQVAIYGGAFNPPHLAHVFTFTYLLGRSDVDEVWLIPTAAHVFGKTLAPLEDRMMLLSTIVDSYGWSDRVRILDIEGRRDGPSRTFDTLTELSAAHPTHRFRWVIGADNLTERHRWYRFDDLVARWNLIVLGRPGHESALKACRELPWCDAGPTMPSISSTQVRAALGGHGNQADLEWLPSNIRQQVKSLYPPTQYDGPPIKIFGYGRAGRSLAGALRQRGIPVWVWNRTRVDGVNESGDALTTAPSGIWLLTVSDDAIAGVASRLAQTHPDLSEVTAFHCAGRYDVELLAPLASKGCKIGVFHPIQALLGEPEDVQNAWCVVSGTSDVHTVAQKLADWIGGRYVERTGTDAATYHLAAVLTANFVSTLLLG